MSRAYRLYCRHSVEELVAMQQRIRNDPASRNPNGGIWLYTKPVHKNLDDISWAIYYHTEDTRNAAKKAGAS